MLSIEASYGLFVAISLLTAIVVGWKKGWHCCLGVGMAMSMLSASWFEIDVVGMPIDVPVTVACLLLTLFALMYPRRLLSPWTILDSLMVGVSLWHFVVDLHHGESAIGTAARAYGEWWIPYAAGRYAVLHRGSLVILAPWFAGVAVVISLAAWFESWTGTSVWEWLFHPRDDRVYYPRIFRYELLYRASGPARHQLFLAVILFTLIPWTLVLAEPVRKSAKRWMTLGGSLGTVLLGILATVSRGPFLALLAGGAAVLAATNRTARWIVPLALIAMVTLALTQSDRLLWLLDQTERGYDQPKGEMVEINGKFERFSGTRSRLLILKVYGPLVVKGGVFGYGTTASNGFPPQGIPGLPSDPRTREIMGIIDNTYLGFGLRFGLVGVALIALLFVMAIVRSFQLQRTAGTLLHPHGSKMALAFAFAMIAITLELATVYWDYDHGFWVLWCIGTIAGIQAQCRIAIREGFQLPDATPVDR